MRSAKVVDFEAADGCDLSQGEQNMESLDSGDLPQSKYEVAVVSPRERPKENGSRLHSIFVKIGLATSTATPLQKERHREVIKELRATGALKGVHGIDEHVVGHPVFAAMLEKYDTNHDGQIDAEEITAVVKEMNEKKQ
jgi:hypothetical protein